MRKLLVELLLLRAHDSEVLNAGLPRFATKHLGKLFLDGKIFVIMERSRALAARVSLWGLPRLLLIDVLGTPLHITIVMLLPPPKKLSNE